MSINVYEQMATGVTDITSIALVTLEVIHNALLINELRLRFACRELLGNLAARKHRLNTGLQLHTEIFQLCLHDISRILVFKGYDNPSSVFCRRSGP